VLKIQGLTLNPEEIEQDLLDGWQLGELDPVDEHPRYPNQYS
jgi:hypothetical protein